MSDVNKQLLYVAEMLKKAGATVPAPQAGGTIESAMLHGLSIALVIVEEAIAAAEKAQQAEPVAWKHDCAALLMNDVELWVRNCPHCGKPRAAQLPAVAVPDGWLPDGDGQIPTEVSAAGVKVLRDLLGADVVGFYEIDQAFRAMLAAASKP